VLLSGLVLFTCGAATCMVAANMPMLLAGRIFDRIPQAGIWRNDHIMMWNTNSDQIADLVLKWTEKHIEKRKVKTPW
jgi:hypothetical protein